MATVEQKKDGLGHASHTAHSYGQKTDNGDVFLGKTHNGIRDRGGDASSCESSVKVGLLLTMEILTHTGH